MQISTTARHCEFDPVVREFAERRLERFQRLSGDIHEAHLILTAEKYRLTAEITVKLRDRELVSRGESNDAHAAIDGAAARLEEQLRRYKDRRLEQRREGRDGAAGPGGTPEPEPDGESPGAGEA